MTKWKLSASAQEEKRRTAAKLRKKSESIAEIARTLDVSNRAVQNWISAYKVVGLKALSAKKRGQLAGVGRQLKPEQEQHLQKQIADKQPDQLKLDYVLWIRKAVMEPIERECGIKMLELFTEP